MLTSLLVILFFLLLFNFYIKSDYFSFLRIRNNNLVTEILSKHFTGRRGAGNGLSGFIMTISIGKYTKRCHISKYSIFIIVLDREYFEKIL